MNDDLIKRLECGVATRSQAIGGFTFDISATGEMIREAAAALSEAHATIARLEAALREIIDASSNTGIEMGTVGMRVAERVEDIARAALSPREGEG